MGKQDCHIAAELRKFTQNQSGAVLILVLAMVSVLSWAALQAVRTARSNTTGAGVVRQSEQARLLLQAATRLARATITADSPKVDSLHEAWTDYGAVVSQLEQGREGIVATLVDAHARMNINEFGNVNSMSDTVAQLGIRLLKASNPKIPSAMAELFIWRCKDWIDANTVEARYGRVEHEVYAPDPKQAQPLNRAFWSMQEVYAAMRGTPLFDIVTSEEFRRFFTVHMKTKININTASSEILQRLPSDVEAGRRFAKSAVEFRKDKESDLTEGWPMELDNGAYARILPVDLLTTKSEAFLLEASAPVGFGRKGRRTQILREGGSAKVIFSEPMEVMLQSASQKVEEEDSVGH